MSSLHCQRCLQEIISALVLVTGLLVMVPGANHRRCSDGLTELKRFFSHQKPDEDAQTEGDKACQCPAHERKAASGTQMLLY